MKDSRIAPRKINTGALAGTAVFLFWAVVVLFLSFLVQPSNGSGEIGTANLLQEKLGQKIQEVRQFDLDRHARLQEQWGGVVQQIGMIENSREGNLQESLGQAIASTGKNIMVEQAIQRNALIRAAEEFDKFNQEKAARRQQQLGMAVLWAARRAPQGGDVFQTAFQKRANYLKSIDSRIGQRLESNLQGLLIRQAEFPNTIPLLYNEAVQSAQRSARVLNESQLAWAARDLDGLRDRMVWRRQPQDYLQLAGTVREILSPPRWATGFEEYGLPALVGLMLAMAWVSSITRKDQVESGVLDSEKPHLNEEMNKPNLWAREVFSGSQAITLFSWPKEVIFGSNISHQIGRYASKDKKQKAMMITDAGVYQCGLLDLLTTSFSHAGIECSVYDQVRPEVPDTVVYELLEKCRDEKIDLLVAVGGGSVIDTTKAVGMLLTNGGRIQDYEGADKVLWQIPRFYVVPTTAGCGSEASQFCVVLDTTQKRKIEIFSRQVIPHMIFIDPMLTLTMPAELTASSGIDALANCIEAYFSTWASPLTDALSLHAIRLVSGSLRAAVANGGDLEARQQMAMAAFEAGLAFTNAHAGAVHALGHPIAGLLNVPQRLGNAILLPHVMRRNMNANIDRMVDVASAIGERVESLSKHAAAEKAVAAVQCLMVDIGLPTTLDKVGVMKESIAELSQQALQDAFLKTNPCILNRRDIEDIYERAFEEYSGAIHTSSGHRREMVH
jgi:alcohol dehydrogenase